MARFCAFERIEAGLRRSCLAILEVGAPDRTNFSISFSSCFDHGLVEVLLLIMGQGLAQGSDTVALSDIDESLGSRRVEVVAAFGNT